MSPILRRSASDLAGDLISRLVLAGPVYIVAAICGFCLILLARYAFFVCLLVCLFVPLKVSKLRTQSYHIFNNNLQISDPSA